MILKFLLLIFVILFVITISPVYAQHHSGSLAPPIDLDGLKVAVSTTLFPEDFSYGDAKTTNLSIRFFDTETNVNIPSVTYRVQIFQDNNLVANEYFYDEEVAEVIKNNQIVISSLTAERYGLSLNDKINFVGGEPMGV